MNYNVKLSDEVREALALGRPVIALESTIIAHGMRVYAKKLDEQANTMHTQKIAKVLHISANMHALSLSFAHGAKLWRAGKLE